MDQVWDSLREWSHRAGLGTLRDLGVARDALEPAALAASTSSSMKANPVSLSGEQLLEMLEAAWSERPGIKFCCIMNAPNFICADVQFLITYQQRTLKWQLFFSAEKRDLTHSLLHTHRSDCLRLIDKAGYARPLSGGPYRYVQPEITPR